MQDSSTSVPQPLSPPSKKSSGEAPPSVLLVAYPKIVFLYPTFLAAILAALCMSLQPSERVQPIIATLFLGFLAVNLVVLSFDFPRATILTLFFFGAMLVLGGILIFTFWPEVFPFVTRMLAVFQPTANATFFWGIAGILGIIFCVVQVIVRFDYWEVRPNELLHHHGLLSNLERFSAPNLRIDKEINDIFEYFLLRSGRLILQPSNERRAVVLDNVPFIGKKEEAITRMLGALQVQVRHEDEEA